MGSIVLLDEHTINKIAAGEVVDRPASIVKELVENSIDAKATNITVEIKNGGIKYIKIVDNGIGFASDDVEMAFERHATSKIRKEEDLLKITSMGFRGEALASIAAIAKVELTTKNINEEIGTHAMVEAGKIKLIEESAFVTGTKIEIRDVFFNVPARFKFLKKDYTEAGYIEDVIIRMALANPGVSIKYINNGKQIISTNGKGDLRSTIYDIFGREIYENVIGIDYEMDQMKVNGMIGLPVISRSTRMHQFTYINNRYIKDKTVNSAIDKACEQKYAINKYAFIVLNLTINPAHVDVNVHPSKLEVKFDDESKVFSTIYAAIRGTLEKNNEQNSPFTNIKNVENVEKINQISKDIVNNGMLKNEYFDLPKKFDFGRIGETSPKKDEEQSIKETIGVNESNNLAQMSSDGVSNEDKINLYINDSEKEETNGNANLIAKEQDAPYITDNSNKETNILFKSDNNYDEIDILEKDKDTKPYKYIGQVFDTYIIIQIKEKMYIIDQHAAHERLLYEEFKSNYNSKDRQSQLLLIPILVELTSKEKQIVDQSKEMFEKAGFILDEFGENTIKISGVPNVGYDIDYSSMFRDLIDELLGANKTQNSEKEFRFLATLACKAAVKGNMKLDTKEQISLIDKMVKLDNPFTCPHGRPTAYEISKYEIERRFLRK